MPGIAEYVNIFANLAYPITVATDPANMPIRTALVLLRKPRMAKRKGTVTIDMKKMIARCINILLSAKNRETIPSKSANTLMSTIGSLEPFWNGLIMSLTASTAAAFKQEPAVDMAMATIPTAISPLRFG